jgi:hypothetical protein
MQPPKAAKGEPAAEILRLRLLQPKDLYAISLSLFSDELSKIARTMPHY